MLPIVALLLLYSQTPAQKPPPTTDPDDPGPPVVKRGGNAPRKAPVPASKGPTIITPLPPAAEEPAEPRRVERSPSMDIDISASVPKLVVNDPLIDQAASAAFEFDGTLPNFLCDEIVTRFMSDDKPPKWKKKDKVEVDLMYINQKEDYRNVRVNGKPLKSGTPEDTGSWSTGDWGATLVDILHPATAAVFKRRGKDRIVDIDCEVFDFTVQKSNSHWTVRYGNPIKPAYKGAIWVDPISHRTLRTEMQAIKLPNDYELDWVEQMTEYGWVKIGEEKLLLPVKSENIACWRYITKCSRNEIEFKNYRKFSAESTISTTESEISFGDQPPAATAPPKAPAPETKKKKKND
ncbi:MAG: hypothetical protein FJW36_14870 [Acidobacteria bacterium]|nr:hypothetical protein [Acidobacteriota bacterium]